MELINESDGGLEFSCSVEEAFILKCALNEVCNGLDSFEFQTRMGAERSEVVSMLEYLHTLLVNFKRR